MTFKAEGITKRFGPTVALDGVDIELVPGEIHALCGGNGSGKSTLIKTITGVEIADGGTFSVGGVVSPAPDVTPAQSHEWGIRCLHQQGSTFGSLTVTENFAAGVGFPKGLGGRIDWRAARKQSRELLEEFEIDASPDQLLEELRPVTRQMVAIARVLQDRDDSAGGVLILDEPTASLSAADVDRLHEAVVRFAEAGTMVMYVTHRLGDLPGFASRATVLRDGRVVGELGASEIRHDRLVEMIVGVSEEELLSAASSHVVDASARDERLVLKDLVGGPVRGASLSVGAGEIVGVAGLVGAGRSSLLEMVFGSQEPESGSVELDGAPLRWRSGKPHDEVALVPENRVLDAAFLPLSLTENIVATTTGKCWRNGVLNHRAERAEVRQIVAESGIKAASEEAPFQTLSGGNQQKAIVARCLRGEPEVLLLDEPTQGVDFAARAAIHETIRTAASEGLCVLVVSSDLEELVLMCNRVVVLVDGVTTSTVSGSDLTPENLERLGFGEAVSGV